MYVFFFPLFLYIMYHCISLLCHKTLFHFVLIKTREKLWYAPTLAWSMRRTKKRWPGPWSIKKDLYPPEWSVTNYSMLRECCLVHWSSWRVLQANSTFISLIKQGPQDDDGQGFECCGGSSRSGRGEPARWRLCEWKTPARDHSPQDSGAVQLWSPSLRYQSTASRLPWLCQ